jgi:hypothetical protein
MCWQAKTTALLRPSNIKYGTVQMAAMVIHGNFGKL